MEGLEKHKTFESILLEWGCFGPIWKNETNFSRKQKLLEIPTGWKQISRPFIERSQGGGGGGDWNFFATALLKRGHFSELSISRFRTPERRSFY